MTEPASQIHKEADDFAVTTKYLGYVSRVNECAHSAPPDLLRKLKQACPP